MNPINSFYLSQIRTILNNKQSQHLKQLLKASRNLSLNEIRRFTSIPIKLSKDGTSNCKALVDYSHEYQVSLTQS